MFRIKMFGGASIDGPEGPLTGRAVQRRRLALLALLATARDRGISRDKLIAYLWPDADAERARHLLSDSIYRINRAVGGEAVLTPGDELRLDPERLSSDVAEFADAVERADWVRAVELHAGPFLDGFFLPDSVEFERWVDYERARFARERARALETLAREATEHGAHAEAVRWWRTLAADDPFSSRIALALMHALERAGDRVAAIRHARIHAELVRSEHAVEPDPAVAELAARLSAAPAAPPARTAPPAANPVPPSPAPAAAARARLAGAVPDAGTAPPAGKRSAWAWRLSLLAALAALAVAATVLWPPRGRDETPAPTAVAVLPFRDLSPGGDEAYLADGITEELMVRLARLEGLRVMGRTSSFEFRDASVSDVAARLGVDAILDGSVRRSGDRLRIVARLIGARDGYELWSETYERRMDDVFAIQDEIARSIVTRLRGRLAGDAGDLPPAAPDVADTEAYNLYLRGRYEWHKRTEQGLRAAADFFARAVERAPDFARAHAGLGDARAVLGFYDYLPPAEAFPDAARAARRALELDPTLASAHATLGYVALYYDWEFGRSEEEFRRTIDLDPGYSTGRQWYANFLTAMGRFDEAVREMRAAQDLDPLSRIANAALGWVLFHAGDFEAAVDQCTRTLELDPAFEVAQLWRGKSLDQLGRRDEALRDLRTVVEMSGGSAITVTALAQTHARSGQPDSARALLRDLEDRGGYLPSYELAQVHLALGDRDQALNHLETALRERSHSMVFLAVDPQLRDLHGDARYERLLREVGLRGSRGAGAGADETD